MIINTGDTGPFTDGAMHALNHIYEGVERGYKMPIIFAIHANNSAISARIDYGMHGDDPMFGVRRIEKRFQMWGQEACGKGLCLCDTFFLINLISNFKRITSINNSLSCVAATPL